MATEIDLDAILLAGRDAIIRAVRGSADEDWPSLILQIPTLIAAIRERDARIAAFTAVPPLTADLVALVRQIASEDVIVEGEMGGAFCRFCGGEVTGHYRDDPPVVIHHEPDCAWVRARALVARLDGGMSNE